MSRVDAPVSVLIPCHDAARYVGEALDSVLANCRHDDEIVVVDDGSNDGSHEVVARYGPRVLLVRQPNGGISAARNAAIRASSRPLIAFLDADDVWTPGSLAARRERLADEPDVDVVYGALEGFFSPELDAEGRRAAGVLPPTLPGRMAGTMLVRRRAFDSVGGFDPGFRIGETLDWVARADASGCRFTSIDRIVLRRRVHGRNTVIRQRATQSDYLRALRAAIGRRRGEASP